MDKKFLRTLRQQSHDLQPLVRIGKGGITETLVEEILKHLKKRKLVKVKLLQSFEGDRKETAQELVDKTESVLVLLVGGTVVLWRR
jgi:RNA-binding protein